MGGGGFLLGLVGGVWRRVWCCCVVVHEPSPGMSQVRLSPRHDLRLVRVTSRTDPAGSYVHSGGGGGVFAWWRGGGGGGGGSFVFLLKSG